MDRTIYFGPPGTGKTYTLLGRLEHELRSGVPADRIAFLTFTRRARLEAIDRVRQQLDLAATDLPYFRTIHSMAFRALKLGDGDVLSGQLLRDFGDSMGLTFGDVAASEMAAEGICSANQGDMLMALDNLSRVRIEPLKKTWADARLDVDWLTTDQFARSYRAFKDAHGVLDFTDVLAEFVRSKLQLPVDVCFVDEAQDLSSLQWLAVLDTVASCKRQYIAGDDDQAIYRWAGADAQTFMQLQGTRQVLGQSHRLPRRVHQLAQSILRNIKQRVTKDFNPRDCDGTVQQHASVDGLPVPDGHWLWLVRNRYLMANLQRHLEQLGLAYTVHGRSSIVDTDRDAIYTWERLRGGKSVNGAQARVVYKHLRTRLDVKHGFKLLPGIADDAPVDMAQLRDQHGLLAQGTWFDVLHHIPIGRQHYYRKLLRQHGTLKLPSAVTLETIHGAKGAEAAHVALFLDMSRRTYDEYHLSPDDEHRVWYVGATRARDSLHLVQASGRYPYTGANVAA